MEHVPPFFYPPPSKVWDWKHVCDEIGGLPKSIASHMKIASLNCAIFGHERIAMSSQFGEYGLHRCKRCGDMRYPAIDVKLMNGKRGAGKRLTGCGW
jgi:hypothetical protein